MEDQYNKIVYSTRNSFEAVVTRMVDDEMQKLYEKKRNSSENKSKNNNYYWSNKYGRSLIKSIGEKKI